MYQIHIDKFKIIKTIKGDFNQKSKVCLEQNEYEMIVKDTEALSREELKAVIDYWEDEAENSIHEQIQSLSLIHI